MALCRCQKHPPRDNEKYAHHVQPVGYPNTSSICGRTGCADAGVIWLTQIEYNEFLNGKTIFEYASNVSKVRIG